jgi:acetylornithine deacetylase/succinyl-diaminopimelate desuccinylase-like protein
MKDFDAIALAVVRERQRAGRLPDRPVTLVFTADEEAGGKYGARFLVEEHSDLFEGCTEAVGEVGGFSTHVGGQRLYVIETGERGMAWVRLTADGTAGHGSMAHPDNALVHLARALVALAEYQWPASPGPAMTALLTKVRELTGESSLDPDVVLAHFGPGARMLGAGVRDSVNPTMLDAGFKHNVIPGKAVAYADGRFLPGHGDTFHDELRHIVGDKIVVDPYWSDIALEYPFEGDLVDAMCLSLRRHDPGAHIAPFLMSAGTDAKHWDRLGITGYGFTPLRLPENLDFTALFHGVDERVPLDALEFGCRVFDEFLGLL